MKNLLDILIWWLLLQLIGLVALPLAFRLFRKIPSRGYAFARPLGLLLIGYFFWVGASLGFLRNQAGGILFALIAVAGVSWWAYHRWPERDEASLLLWLREHWWLVAVVEAVFAFTFAGWAWFRSFSPELTPTGGEKFMEIAFINAILRSETFPPLDPWLSGFAISYYYFGYVMTAMLIRLTGVPTTNAFTLGVAHLFALTVTGAFSVTYNLVRSSETEKSHRRILVGYGMLGSTLIALMGNLEGVLEIIRSKGLGSRLFWEWVDIPGLWENAQVTGEWFPTGFMWWWRASRVIRDRDPLGRPIGIQPIDEFPFFSFILGDMHAHVLALPFVLLAVALALTLFRDQGRPSWIKIGLLALLLGGVSFLNFWDFPIYLILTLLAYALRRYREFGEARAKFWKDLGLVTGSLFGLCLLFYMPFYIGFQSQAGGILPNLFFSTRLHQFFIMFGPFLFVLTCWLGVLTIQWRDKNSGIWLLQIALVWLGTILLFPACMLVSTGSLLVTRSGRDFIQRVLSMEVVRKTIGERPISSLLLEAARVRLSDPWTSLLLSLLIAITLVLIHRWLCDREETPDLNRTRPVTIFALILALIGLALPLTAEWIYLQDVFGVRMNTVFKFYFQGWVLMGLASAYGSYHLLQNLRGWRRLLFGTGLTLLLISGLVYTTFAGYSRANGLDPKNWTLDSAAWIAHHHPDDYAAVKWLRAHTKGAPVILEAPGVNYDYEGRISALTGLPTVLGWAGHENQWRGSYTEQNKRKPDIETIYTTQDGRQALELLHKWQVDYVIVGSPERRYVEKLCNASGRHCSSTQALRKFQKSLEPVFEQGQMTIYLVPKD